MTFLDDCLCGRSQHFTFARRELFQKIASAALLFFVPRLQSTPEKYPKPQFCIGDRIIYSFLSDEEKVISQFGEIVGSCFHPKMEQWQYLINWTCENSAGCIFDDDLIAGEDLRLVTYE